MRYFKKWYETRAEALPVENCKSYRDWFNRKDLRLIHLITKDNRKTLRKIFGAPDTTWTGEFRFSVWIREFKGETFLILTAKTKGTCIELCHTNYNDIDEKASVIFEFLDDLIDKIKETK